MDCEFCSIGPLTDDGDIEEMAHEVCMKEFRRREDDGVCVYCGDPLGDWIGESNAHGLCIGNQYIGYPPP